MKNYIFILLVAISTVSIAQNSIRLVDLNSNYLSIDNSNGAFFETGDFTFEMWIKIDAWDTGGYAGYKAGILSYNQSNFWLAIQSQGKPQLRMGCGDLTFSYTASDWVGNWKHVALVRVGETLNWYVDGQLSASKSCSGGKFMDTNTINIGTNPGWTCSIDGWISKIRYVKGTAVYTSDFTPVFEDLENISGTELLLNVANETDAFKDSSNANHTINLHGSNANPYFVANNGPLMPADILMSGDVSIENNSIKNVADPVYAQDAATKSYVDSNVNSFSGSYNDLTDIPVLYNQDEVDALIDALRSELSNQIDNDGDGFTEDGGDCNDNDATIVPNGDEINGDGVDNDCDGEIDELPDNSESSFSTADGKFIFGMGSNSYEISGYYAFDPNTKTFSSAGLTPYQKNTYEGWTKPAVGSNGKIYEFNSETIIRNATDDVSITLPNGYKAYTYYDYVNGFDSNVSSAIFLVRTDSMSEHGVHLAYVDNQDDIQILNPGFEFRGGTEQMSPQYENGYFFIAKYGINNPEEYYIINFNEQNPQAVKINFPSTDSNASPYSKTYAGDGKFYISYRKNNDDYNTKTIYLLDTTADLVNNGLNVSEVFTTSSRADFLTYASNGKLYYNNEHGNNNDTNIYVYDPVTGVESSIAAPSGASSPILLSSYGNTVELNGNLFIRYYFSSYSIDNVKNRLYKLNISDNSLNEVNPNGILNNYQYWTAYGPYNNAYILNQSSNPMFVYDDKVYMIFRGSSDYDKHYIMIYDGNNVELIDPEQSGGLKSFVELMFI